jgi:hypothetical protein
MNDIFADSCCISRSNGDEGVRDRGSPTIVVFTLPRLVVLFDVDKSTSHVFALSVSIYGADVLAGDPIHEPTEDVVGARFVTRAGRRERIGPRWESNVELPLQTPDRTVRIEVVPEWTPLEANIRASCGCCK